MKRYYIVSMVCTLILAGCGEAAKTIKANNVTGKKIYIGLSENFEGDSIKQNLTEKVVGHLTMHKLVKFVDRRKLKNKMSENAKILTEGSSENIKLVDPMQYIITGSLLSIGRKSIVRISLFSVETSVTKSSVTFDYERPEEVDEKVKKAVMELLLPFEGQD